MSTLLNNNINNISYTSLVFSQYQLEKQTILKYFLKRMSMVHHKIAKEIRFYKTKDVHARIQNKSISVG